MKKVTLVLLAGVMMAATVMNIFEQLEFSKEKANEEIIQTFGSGNLSFNHELVKKARSLSVDMRVDGIRQLMKYAKEYTSSDEFKSKYAQWRKEKLGNSIKKKKFGIPNPMKMIDNAIDKQLNKGDNEKKMPADPNKLIKQRLQEFLDLSASVDFDAKLTGMSRTFENPDYEAKGNDWKMCFRAGKAVVQAAREEAQAWLKELQ